MDRQIRTVDGSIAVSQEVSRMIHREPNEAVQLYSTSERSGTASRPVRGRVSAGSPSLAVTANLEVPVWPAEHRVMVRRGLVTAAVLERSSPDWGTDTIDVWGRRVYAANRPPPSRSRSLEVAGLLEAPTLGRLRLPAVDCRLPAVACAYLRSPSPTCGHPAAPT